MSIVISVSGSSAGYGFLIAPDNGVTFSVPLNLSTNDGGTVSATMDATPNEAGDGESNVVYVTRSDTSLIHSKVLLDRKSKAERRFTLNSTHKAQNVSSLF